MSQLFWSTLKLSSLFLVATLLMASRALAESTTSSREIVPFTTATAIKPRHSIIPVVSTTHLLAQSAPSSELEQINQYNQAPSASPANAQLQQIDQYSQAPTTPVAQVTSVSQLSDVQPTDWAFQALQSLVERYGCIAGYPDGTYRGNRALTRYEFAAGLNACLDRVNELIAAGTSNLVRKEDLATLQRLQEEFAAELATLRGRVDSLEARTAELEANQFSTTTKLAGEAILAANGVGNSNGGSRAVVSGRRRGSAGKITDNATFSDRVRLVLNTSFTGQDLLRTRLNARNTTPFNVGVTGTNETRLGFDGDEGNTIAVDQLFYRFPLFNNAIVQIDAANVELGERGFSTFSPFESSGLGSISRYGRFSPIYRVGNSTTNVTNSVLGSGGAGASIHLNPQGIIGLDLAYLAPTANNPNSGFGITNGAYAAVAQVDINASKYFNLGLTYARSYDSVGRRNGTVSIFDNTGTQLANSPFGNVPTSANNYGVEASIRPNKHLIIFGWGGYTQAIASRSISPLAGGSANIANGGNVSGPRGAKADIWYFAGGIALPDIGSKGSLLGLLFGQPPRVTSNDARESASSSSQGGFRNRRRIDNSVSYQAEIFYRYRLNDNIAITPGALIIFNPEANSRNAADYVGTLRTTFTF